MQILDCEESSAVVQNFINSIPEMKDYLKVRSEAEIKGAIIVKLYMKMAKLYRVLLRGLLISAILFVLDFIFFNNEYGTLLILTMVTAIVIMLIYWIILTYKNTDMRKVLIKFEDFEKKDDFNSLIKLHQFYKNYEEIKEMEKAGELTFATKESETAIFIKGANETKQFDFGNLFKRIVIDKYLNFVALDSEFSRLKNIFQNKD